jgi:hypothetical protein
LFDRFGGANLRTFTTLGTNLDLIHAWGGKMGQNGESCLFGIVLLKQVERTSHQARPAPGTLGVVGIQSHNELLLWVEVVIV